MKLKSNKKGKKSVSQSLTPYPANIQQEIQSNYNRDITLFANDVNNTNVKGNYSYLFLKYIQSFKIIFTKLIKALLNTEFMI